MEMVGEVSSRFVGGVTVPVNVATTDLLELRFTVHVPVPVQAPDQPWKVAPTSGVAVRV